ncbi:MAG: RluA family pseudouridine synthase [Paludibacteraceae bacterium]|nr:RluA family pseudouridine synthase [Paludibacteraceae bacterium]
MSGTDHILPSSISGPAPAQLRSPFASTPHPWACAAAEEVVAEMHRYMAAHPESELHQKGKMLGVLVVRTDEGYRYLKAFSSVLDGRHEIEGFVPPIYDFTPADGYFRKEEARISAMTDHPDERRRHSRALQRWLFSQYSIQAATGEKADLLDVFRSEPPILSAEEYFKRGRETGTTEIRDSQEAALPPAGAGECCAPKLLQYAFRQGYIPLALAEFWVGAPDPGELRQEGYFYPACTGKCRPILRFMLRGLETEEPIEQSIREVELLKQIRILYEDDYLLVACKPSGLMTVPGKASTSNLEDYLCKRRNLSYLRAVHRLDRDTSGLVVLAKDEEVYKKLQLQFCQRTVEKVYEAIVCPQPGVCIADSGTIELPLLPNPLDRPRQMVDERYGKAARTEYEVIGREENGWMRLALYPKTGRTHQLRVHCAHPEGLNAPILGDPLYGRPADRMYLHAKSIRFTHPVTSSRMQFTDKNVWS